ncbi:MAG: hypothetical protein UU88_C0003G0047 [Parcubacteria group bacterium GW2011_GWC1_42_11]|uniref:Uncharacterized protein n=1 Tax=Candidatus Nomurabacteria bacterium GW2011_GWC2_42_20 TaxID=1618756 RepID=A0A0G0ZI07_9BACT|nr:MAG: hypothetical protein UU88_C0003G0047 [Parcubacteria group bacterium GW2011_GWC1_42_11]KKS48382.1 MAG: hypothetical protein UV12_C0001G0077 [Candidatus Nomurabacteria bacterium GW2011_GWC2_42_20]KKS59459.1 MAG: hypothetical protein UV24_C0001G0047 [Candidatus Nomurabacteria bacterium GW2011_GWA2_42_41]KKT09958.1 MAG: hypothetical protein UV86_C0001G0060 [Candidatus Nomurabacteria bacterium GW2011_GWB1_43_20]
MIFGFVGSLIFIGAVYYIDAYCKKGMYVCNNSHEIIWMLSMVFVSVFIWSILTYKMKEEIFISWRNFSVVFVLFSFLTILILPFKCDPYLRICKESFSWLFVFAHLSLSLLIIIYKSFKKEPR